ncbi:ankyrin repeat and SOCS box protein 14-like isoform X2 [Syngnathus typhle]|uniref:ankyrin repeat and SOCS box protein 14-like isoform X2 n=1 Tax=Syngnathus typhle TaxID=161592 RepID=UPI002A699C8E|nr:ankyrin repeat and SOCS box protein 14-like isoform X2 [Syngnathus typhle]
MMEDEEDAAMQYMIQQSLLEANKHNSKGADSMSIFTAIRQGREKLVEDLSINHKEVFLQTDIRGWTPLHEASVQSNRAILELTYAASGDDTADHQTARGETPLFLAVERGLVDNADFLLGHGARPDTQNRDQDSPLLIAVRSGCTDLARRLLQRGAAVNQKSQHNRRPLHEASRLGDAEMASLLLEAGATLDARSRFGLTALALAAQAGHLQVMELLLRKGADVLSQAQDEASVLYEACAGDNVSALELLLEYGADANVAKQSGHLPIHRAAHRGHLQALMLLIPVSSMEDINNSGMSPLHSAAAGGHPRCIKALLDRGFDPNYMLHPCVRRGYDDERKSALFFAVSNNDVASVRLLLEAGAVTNQDPVKCLQVALRLGNYELIQMLLRYGANVNFYSRINTTHFPSALQYALNDEVVVRMLCNYGYHVERCFECPYGNGSHVPDDYEGWTDTVIKDTMFCEVITLSWLRHLSGHVVRVLLDYVDHVNMCSKLKAAVMEQQQWGDICRLQGELQNNTHVDFNIRKRSLPAASLPPAHPPLPGPAASALGRLHELPASAHVAQELRPVPRVRPARPTQQGTHIIVTHPFPSCQSCDQVMNPPKYCVTFEHHQVKTQIYNKIQQTTLQMKSYRDT